MTINLSGKAEQYVRELLDAGGFSGPDQVVDLLILKERADADRERTFPPLSETQLEVALLKAVRSPRREYTDEDFDQLRARLGAKYHAA
jgi:hypothetical protein